jgi:peptide/nickel transport system substrate-binding protein
VKTGRFQFARLGLALTTALAAFVVVADPGALASSSASHHAARSVAARAHAIPVRCKTRNKASGTLKYSDWEFPDSLNPYQTTSAVSFETIVSLKDELVQYDDQSRLFPVLLQNLPTLKNGQIKDGGRTIIAHLKQGLRWSNGAEITAADVKFGWQVGMSKISGPYCSGTCDVISSISTVGKYEVIFHLGESYAPFFPNGLPDVWPVTWKGAWKTSDVTAAAKKLFQQSTYNFESSSYPTNGPYQVTEFVKDDRIVLSPMKYYSTLLCGAKVQTLIFAFYSSKPGMIAAASSHETDVTTDYTVADLPELRQHINAYQLSDEPAYEVENLVFNVDPKYNGKPNPLHNTKVRQALALALDKYGLIRSSLGMSKRQAQDVIAWSPLVITPNLIQPFGDKALRGQWDPLSHSYVANTGAGKAEADAKKLLAQAGYSGGFTLDGVTTDGNPIRVSQFAVIQKNWHDIGVTFTPSYVPFAHLNASWQQGGILQHGAFQVAMFDDVGYPDPDSFKFEYQHQYIDREQKTHDIGNSNIAGIHDKSFDTAFNKAASNYDPRVRQHWYTIWQVGVNQKAYVIPLYYRSAINTVDPSVGNFKPNPTASNEWNTWAWFVRARS